MLHIIKFIRGYSSVEFSKFNRFVHLSPQFNFRILLLLLLLLLSHFSGVRPCATPQTAASQAPLSLGLSRQEYWSGLPFPFPRIFLSLPKDCFCISFPSHLQQQATTHLLSVSVDLPSGRPLIVCVCVCVFFFLRVCFISHNMMLSWFIHIVTLLYC